MILSQRQYQLIKLILFIPYYVFMLLFTKKKTCNHHDNNNNNISSITCAPRLLTFNDKTSLKDSDLSFITPEDHDRFDICKSSSNDKCSSSSSSSDNDDFYKSTAVILNNAKLIFYVTRTQMEECSDIIRRVYQGYHASHQQIITKAYFHPYLMKLTSENIAFEIRISEQSMKTAIGIRPSYVTKFMNDKPNVYGKDILRQLYYKTFMWNAHFKKRN
ncbi:uncharacterized protein BX663DRAFT_516739 [Cokeromyces recurvatus]|uniref:uncharacterized protein n=1 Tax=Cokeromyces recurvatus TaxID=90255 RepID=UPI002220E7E1|nr:uncharacterized protein BX663DRAFT_516739 [Cokeromyces recurvatus]KAI7900857.1 hypothetical protein BX663DRAFT_516739 [Cokeromyces recurvatus]